MDSRATQKVATIHPKLDADWSKVNIVPAPPIEAIYGNPGFQGMMYTAGSNAVTSYYTPLRTFGAQVRKVLLDNGARKWGVPVEELATEPSVVVHAKSGRRLTYGDIAAIAEVPEKGPEIKPEQLKSPKDFRLITKERDAGRAARKGQRYCPLRNRRAGAEYALRRRTARAGGRLGA